VAAGVELLEATLALILVLGGLAVAALVMVQMEVRILAAAVEQILLLMAVMVATAVPA
jgi:hypothetical protein